jgi:hypothetical protein
MPGTAPVKSLLRPALAPLRSWLDELQLPAAARREARKDRQGLPAQDPGIERVVRESLAWLCRAQDLSPDRDGGVARHYSLVSGWGRSYPETTGYIVPTLLDAARRTGDASLRERARRMLDWFVRIQFPEGGFQGGTIGADPLVPVTFNTGQILLGLAAGVAELGEAYRPAMRRAADWLRDTQDPDGCWRRHPTPFARRGEKAYETHVAWGLLEAARVEPGRGYAEAALRNVTWAVSRQRANGWIADCCLNDPSRPLTHTLGYALRGLVEAFRFGQDPRWLEAACRTADALVPVVAPDGRLPGRLDQDWRPAVAWVCLTGSVQIAHSLLLLHRATGRSAYLDTARALNRYVRRTVGVDGPDEVRGGVKGAFPVDGAYGEYEYLNWAAKFMIDSNLLEQDLLASGPVGPARGSRRAVE